MLLKTIQLQFLLLFTLFTTLISAQTATIKGIVFDENGKTIAGASVSYDDKGTLTDENGVYVLEIPANREVTLSFSYLGYKDIKLSVTLSANEDYEFNPQMPTNVEVITTVIIDAKNRKRVEGVTSFAPEIARRMTGANAGVENVLMSLPGVSGNNELSTQYAVRGGNYDENLVYVNEIEVYRPFLIRSGQQEGLSFVNTDLTSSVDFSAGGFQAKFGDKLSSVLDIR